MHPIQLSTLMLVVTLALPAGAQTPTLSKVAPAAGRQAATPPAGIAAAKLWNQAGGLLEASSVPTLGLLYPLSNELFVDPATGNVGMGTTAPAYALHVAGKSISGASNSAAGFNAAVGGGRDNKADGINATVAGGASNEASGNGSTVAGGAANIASDLHATVSGGSSNDATGRYSAVPGGFLNQAAGSYSLAAGIIANAAHDRTFVWNGDESGSFSSTGPDQFLIRAPGGVGIGTNAPTGALDVAGSIRSTGPLGGAVSAANPLNSGSNVTLGWLNSVARLRIGGTGSGAQNGLDIQTVGNSSLLRITGIGNVVAKGQMHATAFIQTSDARLKTDVRELEGALELVRGLRGVRFHWDRKRRPEAEEGERIGFLAQEVREVVPEAVREGPDGMLAVSYAELVPVLVEALQEQDRRMNEMRRELDELRRARSTRN